MSRREAFIVEEMGGHDRKPYAVVEHGEAFEGKWKRKCLWVLHWCETEDEARLLRDRTNNP